jgi:hypothetical protein
MSMKRSRRAGTPSKASQAEGPLAFASMVAPPPSWPDLVAGKPDDAFKPYAMTTAYARNDLVLHPKFGKGIVTLVEGSRVEILFEEGPKKLGHAGS